MTLPSITFDNVSKVYGDRVLYSGLDLTINAGQFVVLLGASGSGKTTLLKVLLQLESLTAGSAYVAAPIAAVFQEPRLIPNQRVWRNVLLGYSHKRRLKPVARAALRDVGLEGFQDRWPESLSGGERQRVALARAVIRKPRTLLLDEPFGALDALTRLQMQSLVRRLAQREDAPAALLVTHDVDEAIHLADRILVLRDKSIVFDDLITTERRHDPVRCTQLRGDLLHALGVSIS